MHILSWPNIFNSNQQTTNLLSDKEATLRTLRLLLNTEKGELFGDPYFGLRLKRLFFEQSSPILSDLIIDEIYTGIRDFIPQITVHRSDISVLRNKASIQVKVHVIYNQDNTSDLYVINLTNNIQEG